MHHELHELEARVLKLNRTIQSFSLATTVLPVIHKPGWITHAEIFSADKTLDAMERKIEELAELMRKLAAPSGLRESRPGEVSLRPGRL